MPKERLHINRFDGVVGVTDAHDLPPGTASYAENLDIVTRDGSFVGLAQDEAYSGNFAGDSVIALFEDGDTGTTYDSSSGTLRVVSFSHGGAKAAVTVDSASIGSGKTVAMSSGGQAVHIGTGNTSADDSYWAGVPYHTQFGDAAGSRTITEAEITSNAFGWTRDDGNPTGFGDATCMSRVTIVLPEAYNTETKAVYNSGIDTVSDFDSSNVRFSVGNNYTYYASAVYDGFQEAPLQQILRVDIRASGIWLYNANNLGREFGGIVESLGNYDDQYIIGESGSPIAYTRAKWTTATGVGASKAAVPLTGLAEIHFHLKVRKTTGGSDPIVNRRVSGVKLYRSESFEGEEGNFVESEPRFIGFYFLDDVAGEYTWTSITSSDASSEYFHENGDYYHLKIEDDAPGTYTFQSSTGYSAAVENMNFHWGVSCVSNEYHIIGNCWHEDLEDVDTYLFRSKPYAYSSFDVADYLVLPNRPRALASYNGRVYAFAKGQVYVIDPVRWDIVDTWEGYGVASQQSVTVSEAGLFFASNTGIYQYIANQVKPIGLPVLRINRPRTIAITASSTKVTDVGWLDRDRNVAPVCVFAPIIDSLIVFYGLPDIFGTESEYPALLYHVPTGRWSPLSDLGRKVVNAHTSTDGDVIYGDDQGRFNRMFTGTNRRNWRFVSRQLGEQGEVHKYYTAYLGTNLVDNAPNLLFFNNDPAYTDPIIAHKPSDNRIHGRLYKYRLTREATSDWNASRDFAIEVSGTRANVDVTDITLIRRRITPR